MSNAGVQNRIFFLDLQGADWNWILTTNFNRCYLVGQAMAVRMKERGPRQDHQRLLEGRRISGTAL